MLDTGVSDFVSSTTAICRLTFQVDRDIFQLRQMVFAESQTENTMTSDSLV